MADSINEAYRKYLVEKSDTAEQAKKLGLTSAGWNKWKNAQGEVTHRTENGKLVKIDKEKRYADAKNPDKTIKQVHGLDISMERILDNFEAYKDHKNQNLNLLYKSVQKNAKKFYDLQDEFKNEKDEKKKKQLLHYLGRELTAAESKFNIGVKIRSGSWPGGKLSDMDKARL